MNASFDEFRKNNEYAELENHRIELLKFYGSDAFKAQQAFLEAARATCGQVALKTGNTAEARESARCMYNAFDTLIRLPQMIGEVLTDEKNVEDQEKT